MAAIDLSSISAPLNDGILQLQNGVAMSSTLTSVTDQSNTASTLKLSTTSAQFTSPLRITTDDPSDFYLDCEDGSTNNRFSITRNTASQQVNLNFASNPAGSTTNVGAIRTYVDGVNLSEVMTFREDGKIGVKNNSPVREVDVVGVVQASNLWTSNGNPVIGSYGTDILLGTNASSKIVMVANRTDIVVNSVDVARFSQTGNFLLNSTASDTARLSIKGSGSTSATTSLLVQNSSGTDLLKVTDDGNVFLGSQKNLTWNTGNFIVGDTTANTMTFYVASSIGFQIGASTNSIQRATSTRELFPSSDNSFDFGQQFGRYRNGWFGGQLKIGDATAVNASAKVQIDSTTQGFLPPRMTDAQIRAIATPAEGLIAYNTDISHLCCYQAGAWVKLSHSPM